MRPPRTILWIYEIVHIKDPADTWDIVAAPETGATSLGDFAWLTLQAHSIWGLRSAVRLSCRVGGDSPVPLLIRWPEPGHRAQHLTLPFTYFEKSNGSLCSILKI